MAVADVTVSCRSGGNDGGHEPVAQSRIVGEHDLEGVHDQQQQREQRQECVVREQRSLTPALVVAVLLEHGVRVADDPVPRLGAVEACEEAVPRVRSVIGHAPTLPRERPFAGPTPPGMGADRNLPFTFGG